MREEMGSVYAELNSMRSEMANMRDDMRSMRDEIRALSTTVLRMDGSVQSMAQELGALNCSPIDLHRRHSSRDAAWARRTGRRPQGAPERADAPADACLRRRSDTASALWATAGVISPFRTRPPPAHWDRRLD